MSNFLNPLKKFLAHPEWICQVVTQAMDEIKVNANHGNDLNCDGGDYIYDQNLTDISSITEQPGSQENVEGTIEKGIHY